MRASRSTSTGAGTGAGVVAIICAVAVACGPQPQAVEPVRPVTVGPEKPSAQPSSSATTPERDIVKTRKQDVVDESKIGYDSIDFLDGQTGGRTYEESQRAPGDFEALSSQRPIAVHALEHPAGSDRGVHLTRRLLRNVLAGKTPPPPQRREGTGLYLHTQDLIVHGPRDESQTEEQRLMKANLEALAGMKEANTRPKAKRQAYIDQRFAAGSRRKAVPA